MLLEIAPPNSNRIPDSTDWSMMKLFCACTLSPQGLSITSRKTVGFGSGCGNCQALEPSCTNPSIGDLKQVPWFCLTPWTTIDRSI